MDRKGFEQLFRVKTLCTLKWILLKFEIKIVFKFTKVIHYKLSWLQIFQSETCDTGLEPSSASQDVRPPLVFKKHKKSLNGDQESIIINGDSIIVNGDESYIRLNSLDNRHLIRQIGPIIFNSTPPSKPTRHRVLKIHFLNSGILWKYWKWIKSIAISFIHTELFIFYLKKEIMDHMPHVISRPGSPVIWNFSVKVNIEYQRF